MIGAAVMLATAGTVAAQSKDSQDELRKSTESNYDSLLHSYYVRKYKGVIDNRYDHKAERIYEDFERTPDSVFQRRLQALPTVIPMTFNSEVRNYIRMYVRTIGSRLDVILSLSEFYFPMFEEVLNENGVPLELKYLTIVESALNPKATSRAGAAGLWQFMYRTGRNYGLDVNSLVDERRDPYESSVAAARYLKDLHSIYNDWTLAIAAYNCGPGGVNKAIARSGGQHDFWQIYNYLPRETRGYIPAFIAVNYVMNYYYAHGMAPRRIEIPVHADTLQLRQDALYCHVEKYGKISVEEIRALNPQYRTDLVPVSSGYRKITLPVDIIPQVIRAEDSIYKATRDSLTRKPVVVTTTSVNDRTVHKVRKGETLSKVARKYGVSESEIRKWNAKRSSTIRVGERLVIYKKGANAATIAQNSAATASAQTVANMEENGEEQTTKTEQKQAKSSSRTTSTKSVKTHKPQRYTVKSGDNLTEIANKYGTTVSNLKKWNKLKGDNIRIGQTLTVKP